MKLRKEDQEFRNPKLFYPDPKSVDLDRVLVNLFLLLRCEGTRPVRRGRPSVAVEKVRHHLELLAEQDGVSGFHEHEAVALAWLESDIFDLVNRGTVREAVASLRPLHLDAHKIRVAKHCRDYNTADALYALLEFGDRQALIDLKRYLDRGRDAGTNRYDGRTRLDLETLTVLKLVEGLDVLHPSNDKVAGEPPPCIGQARVLCDDIQRLLAYQAVIPRAVMMEYLKAILGLHMGLYTLRLSRQLSGWIRARESNATCRSCPVYGSFAEPFEGCPYGQDLLVDMGSDHRSKMAQLAQESAATEYGRLLDLIKALFTLNQLLRFAREHTEKGVPEQPAEVLCLLREPSPDFEAEFRVRLRQLRSVAEDEDAELTAEEAAILDAPLPAFDAFIELVTHVRQKHHVVYLTEWMDKLVQKNGPFGALIQGKSKANPRRWHLGGRLLEVLVQLAVLRNEDTGGGREFFTEPLLVGDLLRWLEARYGFVIGAPRRPNTRSPVTMDENRAFRENVQALKVRLREIGFFDDLSDAFIAQTVRPRYVLPRSGGKDR